MNSDLMVEIYKLVRKNNEKPQVTLESVLDRLLENRNRIAMIVCNRYPVREYLYLAEGFNSSQLAKERKISRAIYREFLNALYKNISREERDSIGMFKAYGSLAEFPYVDDLYRPSSLQIDKPIEVKTKFGNLYFKFAERNNYGVNENTLLGYDDEEKAFVIFLNYKDYLTVKDIIDLFLDIGYKHLHELQHYIDDKRNVLIKREFSDELDYLNDQSEFKADLQMIIGSFGRFLFKNNDLINIVQLKDDNYVLELFNIFVGNISNHKYRNVINKEAQEMFNRFIENWDLENQKEFFRQVYKYTSHYYNTKKDIKFDEAYRRKELIRLFRLEENFIDGLKGEK